jgi:hypothetical protein
MCWNAEVSLNTFLFSSFILALIIYNNLFTQYKIPQLNNIWVYLFLASFIFMQLIEFLIWQNINNIFYNNIFSISAMLLLIIQPIITIMILRNIKLRKLLLCFYLLIAIPFAIYNFSTKKIHSVKGENGHLRWEFIDTPIILIIWFFFFFFSFFYEKEYFGIIFGMITLVINFINYKSDNTNWSMWCWSVNLIMLYYAVYLLIYLPFLENKSIC